jgi:bifunctional DNA-binding transcriptional regulator/antitoxin component of YhaV-PrlF toxin-antitoxin module
MHESGNAITSRTRQQGGSITTTIPTEVTRKMGLRPGEELFWVEDGSGGYHVTPTRPGIRNILEAHEDVLTEYRDVFKALAE